MRTISKRTQYGLKAMQILARRYREGPVMIRLHRTGRIDPAEVPGSDSAGSQEPRAARSKLGRKGGYRLSRPPSSMTVGSIIRMMEGPLAPIPCASETAYRPCAECKDIEGCGTRIIMREVRDAISDVLDRTTLADLLRKVESSRPARDSAELAQYEI